MWIVLKSIVLALLLGVFSPISCQASPDELLTNLIGLRQDIQKLQILNKSQQDYISNQNKTIITLNNQLEKSQITINQFPQLIQKNNESFLKCIEDANKQLELEHKKLNQSKMTVIAVSVTSLLILLCVL